jgi:hypothetical protein
MTDSLVEDGRVRRLGAPVPAAELEATEPSSYAVNLPETQASTAVEDGQVRRIDDWQPPEPFYSAPTAPPQAAQTFYGDSAVKITPDALSIPIIAIHGDAGAGKSTLANLIALAYGGTVLPLAEALRASLVNLGVPRERVYEKPTPEPMRQALEAQAKTMTTLMGDAYFSEQWIQSAYELQKGGASLIVVDDLRRPVEFRTLWAAGAAVISLEDPANMPDPMGELTHIQRSVIEVRGIIHTMFQRHFNTHNTPFNRLYLARAKVSHPPELQNRIAAQGYLIIAGLNANLKAYLDTFKTAE